MKSIAFEGNLDPAAPVCERMLALYRLGKSRRKTPRGVAALINVLKADPDPIVRHEAAFVLGDWRAEEAAVALADAALTDESFVVRHEALESLVFLPVTEESARAVHEALSDSHPDVRLTAEMAESHFRNPPESVSAEMLVDHTQPAHVRWAAAFYIFDHPLEVGRGRGVALLTACLLDDPNAFVRHTAAFMLEELEGVAARDLLNRTALSDPSPLVRHEAAETLGFMPACESSGHVLEQLISDEDEVIRRTARMGLDLLKRRQSG